MVLQERGLVKAKVVEAADHSREMPTDESERQQLASRE